MIESQYKVNIKKKISKIQIKIQKDFRNFNFCYVIFLFALFSLI